MSEKNRKMENNEQDFINIIVEWSKDLLIFRSSMSMKNTASLWMKSFQKNNFIFVIYKEKGIPIIGIPFFLNSELFCH